MTISSSIDICKMALGFIGQGSVSIANIENPTNRDESTLQLWYGATRVEVIRGYVWNFAKARAILAPSSTTPAFDYTKAFTLPSDFVRLLSIGGLDETDYETDYDIEGNEIFVPDDGTNQLKLRYLKDVTDVSKYDALFSMVFAAQLALNIAYAYTLKPSTVEVVKGIFMSKELKAISIDGQERPPKRRQISKMIQARTTYGSNVVDGYTRFT